MCRLIYDQGRGTKYTVEVKYKDLEVKVIVINKS